MAMKREVRRLGGYARKIFMSQTLELTAMADTVIDLDTLASGAQVTVPEMRLRTTARQAWQARWCGSSHSA